MTNPSPNYAGERINVPTIRKKDIGEMKVFSAGRIKKNMYSTCLD